MENEKVISQKIADFYGELWGANHDIDEHSDGKDHLEEFRSRTGLSDLRGLKVLDAGCGIGRTAIAMARLGASCTALDMSEDNIGFVRSNSEKQGLSVTAIKGDVLKLPFEDESFDFVWCNGVIHHTVDPVRAFKEVARIVKRGGHLFVGVYSKGLNSGLKFKIMRFVGSVLPLKVCKELISLRYTAGSKKWHDVLNLMCTPSKQYRFSRKELQDLYSGCGFSQMYIMNEHMNPVIPAVNLKNAASIIYRLKLEAYYLINGGRISTWYDTMAEKK